MHLQWGKIKSVEEKKTQENQPSCGKTTSTSFYSKKVAHQSSQTQSNLLKSSNMPISMKGQGWKNNIVVVEGRGGRRVRRQCEKWCEK